jgi:serine/threonine protein kinase
VLDYYVGQKATLEQGLASYTETQGKGFICWRFLINEAAKAAATARGSGGGGVVPGGGGGGGGADADSDKQQIISVVDDAESTRSALLDDQTATLQGIGPLLGLANFVVGERVGKRHQPVAGNRYYGVNSAVFRMKLRGAPSDDAADVTVKAVYNPMDIASVDLTGVFGSDFAVTEDPDRFHPNIVRCLGHFVGKASQATLGPSWDADPEFIRDSTLFIVMETMSMSLKQLITSRQTAGGSGGGGDSGGGGGGGGDGEPTAPPPPPPPLSRTHTTRPWYLCQITPDCCVPMLTSIVDLIRFGGFSSAIYCFTETPVSAFVIQSPEFGVIMQRLLRAVVHLTSKRIVHRDIKPDNILVDVSPEGAVRMVKLADFGECLDCVADDIDDFQMPFVRPEPSRGGSPMYLAPEVMVAKSVSMKQYTDKQVDIDYSKNDVFACGMVAHYMLTGGGADAFSADHPGYSAETYNKLPAGCCPDAVATLVWNMVNPDAKLRLSANEALCLIDGIDTFF